MSNFKLMISVFLLVSVIISSCGQKADNSGQSETTSTPAGDGTAVTIAGVTFTPPANWVDLGPSGMRKASYYLNPVADEADSATMTVFYFGPTSGGTIEDNLERWINQMSQPDGGDPHEFSQMNELTVEDMTAHLLEVPGTYASGSMMGNPVSKENYLMVGVVLEAPEGNLFFKLTGPENTAKKMADELVEMVKKIKKI